MSGRFEIINPLTCPDWNDMLPAASGCSFFHTSNWARVLHEAYGYRPVYLTAMEEGRLAALVPMMEIRSALTGARGISLPFTDVCEPFMTASLDGEEAMSHLKKLGLSSGWKYIELRGQGLCPESTPSHLAYYHHTLSLATDEASIMSRFKVRAKKNLRKAAAAGVGVEICTSLGSLQEFYRLHCMTRKRHGVPPQPFSFFRKIHEHVIAKGQGLVFLAPFRGEYIAGAVCFHFGDSAVLKFSASDQRYKNEGSNHATIWASIRHYARAGLGSFSFGRTDLYAEGLRNFKESWGTREEIIKYYRYDLKHGAFTSHRPEIPRALMDICRRLPVPVLKFAGSLLYRHIG